MALRVPIQWLKDYVDTEGSPHALAERLTLAGLEVETVTEIGSGWDRAAIVVGEITKVLPHPNADRLCLAVVACGKPEPMTVVTGAPNIVRYLSEPMPGPIKAPFAMVGAELIDGHVGDGRRLKLKAGNIRGVRSEGMVCSEKELGISEDHEGILILPADAPVGTPLADYLGDAVLEFDVKGGFAHLMCIYGVARETAALLGRPLRDDVLRKALAAAQAGPSRAETSYVRLEVTEPALCPRITATLIEGIAVQPSPFWLQQRLLRAGMRPINAVVDATNYVMLELGQPIHAYDYAKLRPEKDGKAGKSGKPGQKGGLPLIRVRPARAGEKMKTLDGVERTFDERMLLITDGGGPVGVAGIMGGLDSEIGDDTTTVLLEAANFEFLNTRRTSHLLKLRTEAGDRFGRRLDPELAQVAGLRCARLIAELCGGTVRAEYGDFYPHPATREPIALHPDDVTRLLGVSVPRGEIVRVLRALEFTVDGAEQDPGPLIVTPPSHRMDVSIPADLVEEVGRIHGYDRMAPTLMRDELPPQQRNLPLEGAELLRDLLTGCGLDELITYSIIALDDVRKLHPERPAVDEGAYVRVRNPLSAERAHLRRRLLPETLNAARNNLRFLPRVAIFELGAVFLPRAGALLPDEPAHLCAVLTGSRQPASWLGAGAGGGAGGAEGPDGSKAPGFDFFDVKGMVETLLKRLEINDATWEYGADAAYHPGRSAVLKIGGEAVGQLGELHPRVVDAFGLPAQPVCAAELDVPALLHRWREDRQMAAISTHPPVYEDLAFVVQETVPAEQARALIAETGRPLVRDVTLFDLYRGDQVGAGRKSLAYALAYQADDRTLTDDEVAKVRARIVKRLEKELDAQLRA